ncbi:MAG: SdrD B-like domain-containing protein [Caldilineaceae bacterium]
MFISFLTRREMAFVRYLTVLQLAVIVLMLLNTLLVHCHRAWGSNTSPAIATSVSRLSLQRKTSTVGGDETLFLPLVRRQSEGQITGNVFDDRNYNGTHETDEQGVSNVTVAAYDESGTRVRTTTTENGRYTLKGLRRQLYRVEFYPMYRHRWLLAPMVQIRGQPWLLQRQPRSMQRWLPAAAVVDLALVNTSAASCTDAANLTLATSCYAFGEPADEPSIITFPTTVATMAAAEIPLTMMVPIRDCNDAAGGRSQRIGLTALNTLYAAAFIKRHSALGPDSPVQSISSILVTTQQVRSQIDAVSTSDRTRAAPISCPTRHLRKSVVWGWAIWNSRIRQCFMRLI